METGIGIPVAHYSQQPQVELTREGLAEDAPSFGGPQVNRRCAVAQERTLPALEAAHIRPYRESGVHEASNGLLLRRDIYSLFDAGYVTFTPEMNFEVSRRIHEEFDNGRHYHELHGQPIQSPDRPEERPDPDALTWHNEKRYNG